MKSHKLSIFLSFTVVAIVGPSDAASIRIDWSNARILGSRSGVALSAGGAGAGDGTLLELGYYSSATLANPFSGSWMILGSSTMGDNGVNLAGWFSTSLTLTEGSFTAPAVGTPLAIRYYDSTTLATSSYFNAASGNDGSWSWIAPTSPEPVLSLVVDKNLTVVFQSVGPANPFNTNVGIPEPGALTLIGCVSLPFLFFRRRRRPSSVC